MPSSPDVTTYLGVFTAFFAGAGETGKGAAGSSAGAFTALDTFLGVFATIFLQAYVCEGSCVAYRVHIVYKCCLTTGV